MGHKIVSISWLQRLALECPLSALPAYSMPGLFAP